MVQHVGPPQPPYPPQQPEEDEGMQVMGYQPFRAPEGHVGQGIMIMTSRGSIFSLFHPTATLDSAVVWVWGARGGVSGPAGGIFTKLSEELAKEGVASLRVDYRVPNHLPECVLDTLAAVALLEGVGFKRVALVGHSFGGAVVITAAQFSPLVKAVVGLSSQNAGAEGVASLSPRPLLLVHGMEDSTIPPRSTQAIYDEAKEPKEVKWYEGAGHGLGECKDQLHDLLKTWLIKNLRDAAAAAPQPPKAILLRPDSPGAGGPPGLLRPDAAAQGLPQQPPSPRLLRP